MTAEKGLGRGLGAILGQEEENESISILPITKIEPRTDQPRRIFEKTSLENLSDSIRQHGVLQPLTVRAVEDGYYQIIMGERRWRAARMAGLTEVPVLIIEADDKKSMELALIENLQREDLNPLEEAEGYRALVTNYGMTQEELAKRVGVSRPAVANAMRLLSLPDPIKDMLENGSLTSGHARALMQIEDEGEMLTAAQKVINDGLSVRQTERISKHLYSKPKKRIRPSYTADYIAPIEEELTSALGRKVRIVYGEKAGRVEMEYYGDDDFEAVIEALRKLKISSSGSDKNR